MEDLQMALNKAKIGLMSKPDSTFFTTVCFSLKHTFDEEIPTACTNGKEIRFNPHWFLQLDPEERIFLMLHETLHVAYLHMARLKERNPQKWNIAADHVINLQLLERGFRMPQPGLADRQYTGLSTEEVYDKLPDDPSSENFDMDLVEGDPGNAEGLEQDVQDILIRAAMQAKMAGDSPGSIPGEIQIFLDKLLNPQLPWQRILQKYLRTFNKSDYTFRKPNRRHFPKHILPGLRNESLISMAIAVDTSGSVSDIEFTHFISEVHCILKMMKPEKITILQFDTQIKAVDEVRNVQELSRIVFTGRGGTRIEPVLEWAEERKPQVLLVFSDGYFRFYQNEFKRELVWLIHNNKQFNPPFGKVIQYEMEK